MKKTAIFYSFSTKKTTQVAEKIRAMLGKEVEDVDVDNIDEKKMLEYDNLIIGVPTWFDGELPVYWDELVPALEDMDFSGKKIAIFGLGDQKGYPENFADGIGLFGKILEKQGAELVGFTSIEGYEFEQSEAVRNNQFMGLALDFENQIKENDPRITGWVKQIAKEFS